MKQDSEHGPLFRQSGGPREERRQTGTSARMQALAEQAQLQETSAAPQATAPRRAQGAVAARTLEGATRTRTVHGCDDRAPRAASSVRRALYTGALCGRMQCSRQQSRVRGDEGLSSSLPTSPNVKTDDLGARLKSTLFSCHFHRTVLGRGS